MFRTDIIHFLQSWDHTAVYWFWEIVSMIGTLLVLTLLMYIFLASSDLRKGILVTNIFLYTVVITVYLKDTIDYPRPLAIDPTLNSFGFETGPNLTELQPKSFWGLFNDEILVEIRKSDIARQGFPSGHTSLLAAMLLGASLVFRKRWLYPISGVLIVLIMVSRMYLGRHFLADVLGGLLLAALLCWLVYSMHNVLVNKNAFYLRVLFFLLPILLIPLNVASFQLGGLLGLNLAFLIVDRKLMWKIAYRSNGQAVIGVATFFILGVVALFLPRILSLDLNHWLTIIVNMVLSGVFFIIAAKICVQLGFWKSIST